MNHMNRVITQAGWTGFVLGMFVGMALAILLVNLNSPNCTKNEVIVWTGEEHDHCVPLGKFQKR